MPFQYFMHDSRTGEKKEITHSEMHQHLGFTLGNRLEETGSLSQGSTIWEAKSLENDSTTMPLPADPDNMNDVRAAWAAEAIEQHARETHTSDEDDATKLNDLLCNLRHWCDRNEVDFDQCLLTSEVNYEAETQS